MLTPCEDIVSHVFLGFQRFCIVHVSQQRADIGKETVLIITNPSEANSCTTSAQAMPK
jgi:hypothetical protein